MFNGPAFIRAKGAAEIGDGERVLTDPRGVTQWPAAPFARMNAGPLNTSILPDAV
ncbi:hypothetical protein MAHJHV57_51990 [Mycobacterium avium subsp. hominissuis]